jgi:hypothetical protein
MPLVAGPEVTAEIGAPVVAAAHPATAMVGPKRADAAGLHSSKSATDTCATDMCASKSAADTTATEAATHMAAPTAEATSHVAATTTAVATSASAPAPARRGVS